MAQNGETRERLWTESEIADLIERAHVMGMNIDDPNFKEYRLSELERMVSTVQ